jgi:hypothetical protein
MQDITKKRGDRGVCTLVLCSLATVTSCINASVGIATKKSLMVKPLFILSISACLHIMQTRGVRGAGCGKAGKGARFLARIFQL